MSGEELVQCPFGPVGKFHFPSPDHVCAWCLRARLDALETKAPRPYQLRAVERIKHDGRGVRRLLVVGPTGCGKTFVAVMLILEAVAAGRRVLFVAHRRELIRQTVEHLVRLGIDRDSIGLIMGSERATPLAPVQVASIQTLSRRSKPPADLVIVDEAHHAMADTYQALDHLYPSAIHLGFTATPERLDGKPLAFAYDAMTEIASPVELVAEGFLVAPQVWTVPKELLPDLRGVRSRGGDYERGELGRRANRRAIVGSIVEHWLRHAERRRTVVYAASVKHATAIAAAFRKASVRAVVVTGETPAAERDAILGADGKLARGDVDVVVNCDILGEGWDLPACKCVVLARPTKSLVVYLQQTGRILRPWNGVTPVILDHAGNAMKFGFPIEERGWSLFGRPKGNGEAPCWTCEACLAINTAGATTCHACGAERPKPVREPEEKAAELVRAELDAKKRAAQREALEALAREKGAPEGWVERVLGALP